MPRLIRASASSDMSTADSNAPETPTGRILRRFRADPMARISVIIIILFALLAGGTALLSSMGVNWPYDPNLTSLEQKLLPPRPPIG